MITFRHIFHILIGCIGMMIAGFQICFSVYSEDLKNLYHLSQTQVSILSGTIFLAGSISYFNALIYEALNSQISFLIWMILGTVSSFLIYLSTYYIQFHVDNFWLLAVYFAVLGFATGGMFIMNLSLNINKTPEKYVNCVIGISLASFLLMLLIMSLFCSYIDCTIRGLFAVLSILLFSTNLLMSLLEKFGRMENSGDAINSERPLVVEQVGTYNGMEENEESEDFSHCCTSGDSNGSYWHKLGLNTIFSLRYQLLLWSITIPVSISYSVIFNVKTLMISMETGYFTFTLNIIGTIVGILVKIIVPPLTNLHVKVPRIIWCMFFLLVQTLVIFLCVWYESLSNMVSALIIIAYITMAIHVSLDAVIYNDIFESKHFARDVGMITTIFSAGNMVLNIIFGELYDLNLDNDERNCYGLKCFKIFFIISTLLGLIAFLVQIVTFIVDKKRLQHTRF